MYEDIMKKLDRLENDFLPQVTLAQKEVFSLFICDYALIKTKIILTFKFRILFGKEFVIHNFSKSRFEIASTLL